MVHRLTLCAVLCLSACGGASPPPPVQNAAPAEPVASPPPAAKTGAELAMAKMDEYASRMCGCVDKACADTVQADMVRWSQAMANDPEMQRNLDVKPSEAELTQMTELGQKYGECMTKAMTPAP